MPKLTATQARALEIINRVGFACAYGEHSISVATVRALRNRGLITLESRVNTYTTAGGRTKSVADWVARPAA